MSKIETGTFAEACFDSNTVAELKACLAGKPDAEDCRVWGLTGPEWVAQIELAIVALTERDADGQLRTVASIFQEHTQA